MNQYLEAEAIHIFWEVAAEAKHPVFIYSIGKDSPYESPSNPEIQIKTSELYLEKSADLIK